MLTWGRTQVCELFVFPLLSLPIYLSIPLSLFPRRHPGVKYGRLWTLLRRFRYYGKHESGILCSYRYGQKIASNIVFWLVTLAKGPEAATALLEGIVERRK